MLGWTMLSPTVKGKGPLQWFIGPKYASCINGQPVSRVSTVLESSLSGKWHMIKIQIMHFLWSLHFHTN